MKKLLLLFLLFTFQFTISEGQSWVWAVDAFPNSIYSGGDVGRDHSVTIDSKGNVYVVGIYWDTLTYGHNTLIGGGICLVKYNSNGAVIWARSSKQISTYWNLFGTSVTTDKYNNVYISGSFNDTLAFGLDTLYQKGYYGTCFLIKYDSSGNVIWAKQSIVPSSTSMGSPTSISVDKLANIYMTGYFTDTIKFGSFTLTTNARLYNGSTFLVKYDSNGNVIWAKQATVPSSTCWGEGMSLAIDRYNNIYITGAFKDSISFDTTELKMPGTAYYDVFLVKYESNGNVVWAKQATVSPNNGGYPYSISIDIQGNVYVTGQFDYSIVFGTDTLIGGYESNFLVKYDSNGNVKWVNQGIDLAGKSWFGSSLASDTTSLGGGFLCLDSPDQSSSFKVKFGTDTFNLMNNHPNYTATIILHFDSSGKVLCGTIYSDGYENDGDAIAVDGSGKYVYCTGDFDLDTAIFGTDTLYGGNDVPFIARWQPCNTSTEGVPSNSINPSSISLFPNPNTGKFFLRVENEKLKAESVEVYNVLGEQVFTSPLTPVRTVHPGGPLLRKGEGMEIDLSSQPAGVYFYRVLDEAGTQVGNGKFVIAK